jgi:hypothetical protein
MAGNSGESKMGAYQQSMAIRQRDPIDTIVQGIRVIYLACLICWPQAHLALCRFLGT